MGLYLWLTQKVTQDPRSQPQDTTPWISSVKSKVSQEYKARELWLARGYGFQISQTKVMRPGSLSSTWFLLCAFCWWFYNLKWSPSLVLVLLVHSSCRNKIPQTGRLTPQVLEIQDLGTSRAEFWLELFLPGLQVSASSPGLFSGGLHSWYHFFFLEGPQSFKLRPHPFDLIYSQLPLERPSLQDIHTGY